ncbi:calcium-binding protein [Sphingomonas sp. DT-51]|uniref:calcium-binding protein n=1 Tax=Sphingomonas sp. DT-51 TaxID=3396165 RepID=UPI003F1D6CB3
MTTYWGLRENFSSRKYEIGIGLFSFSIGFNENNPSGDLSGGVGASVSIDGFTLRYGQDLKGNWNMLGGVGLNVKTPYNVGKGKAFIGGGWHSSHGPVGQADLDLNFPLGQDNLSSGIRFGGRLDLGDLRKYFARLRDPIVIDLNGNGANLTSLNFSNAYYDFGNDGVREKVSWFEPSDGILVADLDKDGVIASAVDLFGAGPSDAFASLSTFDQNGDGKIDSNDQVFSDLRVWIDANADGVAADSELLSLEKVGVRSVSVAVSPVNASVGDSLVINKGEILFNTGRVSDAYSVALATDATVGSPLPPGTIVSNEMLALPDLPGSGRVPSLWEWAARSESNLSALKAAAAQFGRAETLTELVAGGRSSDPHAPFVLSPFALFLAGWAGAQGEDDAALMVNTVERFIGEELTRADLTEPNFLYLCDLFVAKLAMQFLMQVGIAPARATAVTIAQDLIATFGPNVSSATEQEIAGIATKHADDFADAIDAIGPLAKGLSKVSYNVLDGAYSGDLSTLLAEKLGDLRSTPIELSWERLQAQYDNDVWLWQLSDQMSPDPDRESMLRQAFRIATGNKAFSIDTMRHALNGTAADDALSLSGSAMVVTGGGSDRILANSSDSIIVVDKLNGNSILVDNGGSDELAFWDTSFSEIAIKYIRTENTLLLAGKYGSVLIANAFDSAGHPVVEKISFADGTVLISKDIRTLALASEATSDDDRVVGWNGGQAISGLGGNDHIVAGGGDDFVEGGAGDDIIDGGLGDDILSGNEGTDVFVESDGNDLYFWSHSEGTDELLGQGSGYNQLRFSDDVRRDDLHFSIDRSSGRDLTIYVLGKSGSIKTKAAFDDRSMMISEFLFANGTKSSLAQILSAAAEAEAHLGGNVWGSHYSDVLIAADTPDIIDARGGNDVVTGGRGNDILGGGAGDDVYRFARGDGQDRLEDYGGRNQFQDLIHGGNDRIEFGEGISPDDIEVVQLSASDLALRIRGTTDQITITNMLSEPTFAIEQVRFADGTTWSYRDVVVRSQTTTGDNDLVYSGYTASNIDGGAGNDTMFGSGDADILSGGTGDDTLYANPGADILTGGTGNDILGGGAGDDVYRFARGDGQDRLEDYGGRNQFQDLIHGGNDRIEFGEGISPDDIEVVQLSASDLALRIRGTTDQITITNMLSEPTFAIEQVRFADGTIWAGTDLLALSRPQNPSNDFDGDGKSDILWRNFAGDVTKWTSSGSGYVINDAAFYTNVVSSWQVIDVADFNGDGKGDILWRSTEGHTANWLSTGIGFSSNDSNFYANVSLDWNLIGSADFNGDGLSDLAWRNQDGRFASWLGNGKSFTPDDSNQALVAPEWRFAAEGDFNSDDRADIVWQNSLGGIQVWFSGNDVSYKQGAIVTDLSFSSKVLGVGDFDGDRKDDLLLEAGGSITVARSQASGFVVDQSFSKAVEGGRVAQVGYYDGDRLADIIVQSGGGSYELWRSDQVSFQVDDSFSFSVPSGWDIQPFI